MLALPCRNPPRTGLWMLRPRKITPMPLSTDDRQFLRTLNGRLRDQALVPEDPLREPLNERPGVDDPVALMKNRIDFSDVQTLQLFTGFDGSGKTTELFRLSRDLREDGYLVLYQDMSTYVNAEEPLPIADLLMIAAGAFNDVLKTDHGIDLLDRSWWSRLNEFIRQTEVRISGGGVSVDYTSPGHGVLGGIKAGLSVKAELTTGSNFRQDLSKLLSANLAQLQRDVHQFFEDGAKRLWEKHGQDKQIVFILDQLEQIRGGYRNWQEVIRTAAQAYTVHLERLAMPYVHCVYSVPAWLEFVKPKPRGMTVLPTVPLWRAGPQRDPYESGRTLFRNLIRRRIDMPGAERLLGPMAYDPDGPIETIISASGGHVRDLLRMLREILIRATGLPVDSETIERVISAAKRDFLPIALDEAKLLHEVIQKQNLEPDSFDEASIERLSNLFNGHSLMFFRNSTEWYDVHPLIRDEVERIIADNPSKDE
jgi:hypothetical protein